MISSSGKRSKGSRVRLTLAIMVLAGVAVSGCGGRAPSAESTAFLEVELDVFSGRPNPRWVVPEVERDSLLNMIASLSKAPGPMPATGLGYRGFILRDGSREILVFRQLVRVRRGSDEEIYRDTVGLEQRLAHDAEGRGITVPPPIENL
jgi:hypothetical protein